MKYSPYSFSKICVFEECQFKFYLKYCQKIKTTPDEKFFEKGRFYHYVLENYPNPLKEKFIFQFNSENKVKEFQKQIKRFIQNEKIKKILKNKRKNEVEIKLLFEGNEFKVFDGNKYESDFYGYVDSILKDENGEVYIIDWKSKKGKDNFRPSWFQLEIYAYWFFLKFPNINKAHILFGYIEDVDIEERILERDKDLSRIEKTLINKINKIEQTEFFEKQKDRTCKWCEYFLHCWCSPTIEQEIDKEDN